MFMFRRNSYHGEICKRVYFFRQHDNLVAHCSDLMRLRDAAPWECEFDEVDDARPNGVASKSLFAFASFCSHPSHSLWPYDWQGTRRTIEPIWAVGVGLKSKGF